MYIWVDITFQMLDMSIYRDIDNLPHSTGGPSGSPKQLDRIHLLHSLLNGTILNSLCLDLRIDLSYFPLSGGY